MNFICFITYFYNYYSLTNGGESVCKSDGVARRIHIGFDVIEGFYDAEGTVQVVGREASGKVAVWNISVKVNCVIVACFKCGNYLIYRFIMKQ